MRSEEEATDTRGEEERRGEERIVDNGTKFGPSEGCLGEARS